MALQCKVETEKEIATRGKAAAFWAYGLGIPVAYLEAKFPPRPEDWLRLVVVLKRDASLNFAKAQYEAFMRSSHPAQYKNDFWTGPKYEYEAARYNDPVSNAGRKGSLEFEENVRREVSKAFEAIEPVLTCSQCSGPMETPVYFRCGHSFCKCVKTVKHWDGRRRSWICPSCNRSVLEGPNKAFEDVCTSFWQVKRSFNNGPMSSKASDEPAQETEAMLSEILELARRNEARAAQIAADSAASRGKRPIAWLSDFVFTFRH